MTLLRVSCCLVAGLLVACASRSRESREFSPQHYRGVVLDARTGAPVGNASVTAVHQPYSVTYLLPAKSLGFTLSRQDGTFDLTIPDARQTVNHLEATTNAHLSDYSHPRKGESIGYNGVLNRVSERRVNTILVRKLYAR